MKTFLSIIALALSLLTNAQIALPYYEDFEDGQAQDWVVGSGDVWFVTNLPDGNWVARSEKLTDGNGYYRIDSPIFNTSSVSLPRIKIKAKLARLDQSWSCYPELEIVVINLDNSEQQHYEYGATGDICSSEDFTITENVYFTHNFYLPEDANIKILLEAHFFDPGWVIVDDIELTGGSASGIDDNSITSTFKVYPTLVQDKVTMSLELSEPMTLEVDVFNELGQVVFHTAVLSTQGEFSHSFNFSTMPQGIYYLKVSNDKVNAVRKFIKN